MTGRRRFVLGSVCVLMLSLWQCRRWLHGDLLPSDAELIRNFSRNREAFERLREFVAQDDLHGRVHAAYFDDKRISKERIAEYRWLMELTDVMRLGARGADEAISFDVGAVGFLDIGTYKGYLFSPTAPQMPMAPSLDSSCAPPGSPERYCNAARHMDGPWWLVRYEYR